MDWNSIEWKPIMLMVCFSLLLISPVIALRIREIEHRQWHKNNPDYRYCSTCTPGYF